MELKTSETKINLMRAFAGESMARNRYNMASLGAKAEGHHVIAKIFDITATQEQAHATVFYDFLKEENNTDFDICASYPVNVYTKTEDLLKAAVHNEYEEYNSAYKTFSDIAAREGFNTIAKAFEMIAEIEKTHAERFENLLKMLTDSTLYKKNGETIWICSNCGHIHRGACAPVACPVCSHSQGYFSEENIC